MKLGEYPRPPADNGRGVHWSPSQYQWGRQDWLKWQKHILDMGLKWIKVNVPPDYNAEAISKRLIDIEVMPVCRFIVKNPAKINSSIEASIGRLIDLGVRYFETNNEPDADVEWVGYRRPDRWEEKVVVNLIHDANRIQNMGGIPAFVAFNSGPNEPRNPIQILAQTKGGRDILKRGLWISLHNYGKGRPFNYPNDRIRMFGDPITDEEWTQQQQPNFWDQAQVEREVWRSLPRQHIDRERARQANPNGTIMTDITGFRAYEYWNQLLHNEGLDSLPIMMTEGGWETDDGIDDFYPQPTAMVASHLNLQMFQFMQGDIDMEIYKPDGSTTSSPVPDYLFALMPWHMGERSFGLDTSGQWEQGAWFSHWHDHKYGLKGELPIIQMMRELPSKPRANGPVPAEWNQRGNSKPSGVTEWDYRFAYLGKIIGVTRTQSDGLTWRLIEGYWQDKDERNPKQALPPGYVMIKVIDEDGNPIPDAQFTVTRGTGPDQVSDKVTTKGSMDNFLGNYYMSAPLGTYTVSITHDGHPSDQIYNVGLGGEDPGSEYDQTSCLFVFQLKTGNIEEEESTPVETVPVEPSVPAESEPSEPTPIVEPTEPTVPSIVDSVEPEPDNSPEPDDEITAPSPPEITEPEQSVENNAASLGVNVLPAPNGAIAIVKRVYHYAAEDRMAPNTLFLDLIDQSGKRAYRSTIIVKDAGDNHLRVPIEKPEAEPGGNMPMWGGNHYEIVSVIINDQEKPVQPVTNLRSDYPDVGGGQAFLVELQLL
ncbi:MAG: hypothetical protein AAF629_01610 [Chloroflexota bacterium]